MPPEERKIRKPGDEAKAKRSKYREKDRQRLEEAKRYLQERTGRQPQEDVIVDGDPNKKPRTNSETLPDDWGNKR